MTATDTITPIATAMRAALIADTGINAAVSQRVYLGIAPDNAAYPHIIMKCEFATEMDATHADLSWQSQQWDIYAVADTIDAVNDITGKISGALDANRLTLSGGDQTLIIRRQGTMPASRIRLSDTISKMMGASTMLVGIRTGGD